MKEELKSAILNKRRLKRRLMIVCLTGLLMGPFIAFAEQISVAEAMLDPVFCIQQPMGEMFEGSAMIEWIFFLIGGIALSVALHDTIKNKTMLPVVVTLSGAFCVIPEVLGDILGDCYRPEGIGSVVFNMMGQRVTWFSIATWFALGTMLITICYAMISRSVQTKWLWIGFAVVAGMDVFLLCSHSLHVYAEPQSFAMLVKLPLWKMTTSTTGIFISAALAYRYHKPLKGWLAPIMFVVTPSSYLAVQVLVRVPANIADNGSYSWTTGILICLSCMTIVALTMLFILKRNPFEMEGKSSL